ncbi:MAG: lipoate-protein ligase LipB [Bacteroidetes bacterium HLUCCA01]|nr:MAG: lipoate-protein ligase LipB [Bacteroidetes bacterium HLUCCA01]
MNTIFCYDLGRAPYRETWDLQAAIQQRLIEEKLHRAAEKKAHINGRKHDSSTAALETEPRPHVQEQASPMVGPTPTLQPRPEGKLKVSAQEEQPLLSGLTNEPSPDVLLLVEHPHVYTLGKSGDPSHLLKTDEELESLQATYVKIDRGGDITYHGPGQIVGYPILDLDRYFTDIHKYLRYLEETIIRVCADYGLKAGRIDKLTGVWVGDAKICAFGIRCSRWVTMHGFALNVNTSLDYFGHIVPCGITDKAVTSLSEQLGRPVDEEEVKDRILHHFQDLFGAVIIRKEGRPALPTSH